MFRCLFGISANIMGSVSRVLFQTSECPQVELTSHFSQYQKVGKTIFVNSSLTLKPTSLPLPLVWGPQNRFGVGGSWQQMNDTKNYNSFALPMSNRKALLDQKALAGKRSPSICGFMINPTQDLGLLPHESIFNHFHQQLESWESGGEKITQCDIPM